MNKSKNTEINFTIPSHKRVQFFSQFCFLKLKTLALHHAVQVSHSNQIRLRKKAHNLNHVVLTYAVQCRLVLPLTPNLSTISMPYTVTMHRPSLSSLFPIGGHMCIPHPKDGKHKLKVCLKMDPWG